MVQVQTAGGRRRLEPCFMHACIEADCSVALDEQLLLLHMCLQASGWACQEDVKREAHTCDGQGGDLDTRYFEIMHPLCMRFCSAHFRIIRHEKQRDRQSYVTCALHHPHNKAT